MNKMLKPTIISISMCTVMAGAAISPALGEIAKAFPETDPTFIKLLLTAPSLMIIPFSFISSFLTQKIMKRSILMLALIIYLIGGVGAQFTNSIELLLAFRLILGIGVGLAMPLSMSLISDYYSGKERVKMMGYNSAFSNLGGIITIMIAGFLSAYGWKVPFNVYWLGLIILVFVFFFLPKNEIPKDLDVKDKKRIPLAVYGYALAMGGVMLAYYSVATNMALYVDQNKLGGSSLAGTVIAFTTIGGMITSLFLSKLEDVFKKSLIILMIFLMGMAFGLIAITQSVVLVMIGVMVVGFGQGVLFPLLALKAISYVPPLQSARVVAITSSATFAGQFLSPIVLDGLGKLFQTPSIRLQYGILGVTFAVIFIVMLIRKTAFKKEIPA